MDRIKFIEHQGKPILFMGFSNFRPSKNIRAELRRV
jgi:hypothetical protein